MHARRLGNAAVIDVSLFSRATFRASAWIASIFGFLMASSLMVLALYFQLGRGESPSVTGVLIGAQGVGSAFAMAGIGRLTARFGTRSVALTGVLLQSALTARGVVELGAGGAPAPVPEAFSVPFWLLTAAAALLVVPSRRLPRQRTPAPGADRPALDTPTAGG